MDEGTWTIGEGIIPRRAATVKQGSCIREGVDKGEGVELGRQLQLGKGVELRRQLQLGKGVESANEGKGEGKKEAREKRKILRSLRFRTKQSSLPPNLFQRNNPFIPTIMGGSWSKDQPKVNTSPVSRSPLNLWNGESAPRASKLFVPGTDPTLSPTLSSALPPTLSPMTPSAFLPLGYASRVSKGFDPFEQEKYMTGLGLSPNGQRAVTCVPLEPLDFSSRSEEYGDHPLDLSIRSKGKEDSSIRSKGKEDSSIRSKDKEDSSTSDKSPLDVTCGNVLIDDNETEVEEDFVGRGREGSEDTRVKRGVFGLNVSKKFPDEDFNLDFDTSSDTDENQGKFESGMDGIVTSQVGESKIRPVSVSLPTTGTGSELELFNRINEPISVPERVCAVSRPGFPCDLCHLSFYSLSHLIIHEPCFYDRKISSGVTVSIGKQAWNFNCDMIGCNQSFTAIQPMRHHLDLHFGLVSCNYDAVSDLVDSLLKLVQPDAIVHFQHDFY